jgi:hypothetical protein
MAAAIVSIEQASASNNKKSLAAGSISRILSAPAYWHRTVIPLGPTLLSGSSDLPGTFTPRRRCLLRGALLG